MSEDGEEQAWAKASSQGLIRWFKKEETMTADDDAFEAWFQSVYANAQPTETERACFKAGMANAIQVTSGASRAGSDLRGRVIVYFRPLSDDELKREIGASPGVDLAAIDAEITACTAEKEEAISKQDFHRAASLRDQADTLRVRRREQIHHDTLKSYPCLELDDGTLVYGAQVGHPFTGFKPSNPEGQQKVAFTFRHFDQVLQAAPEPSAP